MATLSDLTDPAAAAAAVEEFKHLGRQAFLEKYGFPESRVYFAQVDGGLIDSKPLVAAMWAHQHPDRPRLTPADFSGGPANTGVALDRLGMPLVKRAAPGAWDLEVGDHLTRKERMDRFGGG